MSFEVAVWRYIPKPQPIDLDAKSKRRRVIDLSLLEQFFDLNVVKIIVLDKVSENFIVGGGRPGVHCLWKKEQADYQHCPYLYVSIGVSF